MHPIERLRWVARAPEGEVSLVTAEAADALASFGDEPAGLVIACRRLIERRPACGPLWWLASRVLCALDPALEAELAADDLHRDPTAGLLADELPGGTVVVVGWPEVAIRALRYRPQAFGDSRGPEEVDRVLALGDPDREAYRLVRRLDSEGTPAAVVDPSRAGKAVRRASLVLLEAQALGPGGIVCPLGSGGLAAAAREESRPVWLVAGVGRTLPAPLFEALVARTGDEAELLALDAVDGVAGPGGLVAPRTAAVRGRCPVASELLRFAG